MRKQLFLSPLAFFFCFTLSAQNVTLTQQKLSDDFLVSNGQYKIFFHKKDVLQVLDSMDIKLKTDNSTFKNKAGNGTLKSINLGSAAASDQPFIQTVTSLGAYLLTKGMASVYKGDKQLKLIVIDEAPPEAELDGTMSYVYFFKEPGSSPWIFNGRVRRELFSK